MGYPDFVCMGFQKSGTTTLYEILKQHPQIMLCRDVKEPMYYRIPFLDVIGLGSLYYKKRYFGHVRRQDKAKKKGEINAGLTFSGCAKRLKRHMSHDTKMIFMMRNPADRSYSAYKYFLARGFLPMSAVEYDKKHGHAKGFDHYVHTVLDHSCRRMQIMEKRQKYLVFSQSNYAACIGEFLGAFDIRNMKFVLFEDFIQNEKKVCQEIYEFVGVSEANGINYHVKANEGNDQAVSGRYAKEYLFAKGFNYALYEFLAMPHWAPKLYEKYERKLQRIRKKCLVADMDNSKMLPSTRRYLMDHYETDICALERLIGRDLHKIWNV